MHSYYLLALAALALAAAPLRPAAAQTATVVVSQPTRPPVGLYVRDVGEGGRYVTLEDGSGWEIEISDRATTAAWQAEDFVGLQWIAAPRGEYEYRLSRVGQSEQHAAARLAGRRPPAAPQD